MIDGTGQNGFDNLDVFSQRHPNAVNEFGLAAGIFQGLRNFGPAAMNDDNFKIAAGRNCRGQFPEALLVFERPTADFNQYSGFHFYP